ncbi:hypothetical protein DNAM_40 [Pseudomonas phage BroderSalsa]|nr:hypothetical protein DNAM_40 [Pseudomonas phage BroderSalsa]
MPKGTRPQSLVQTNSVTGRSTSTKLPAGGFNHRGPTDDESIRIRVGDQGLAKIKRAEAAGARGSAASTDDQETPTTAKERAAAQAKAKAKFDEELYEKVKSATSKPGGASVRSNYN